MKTLDIIILTYRPGASFAQLLKRLSEQTYPIREIHVVNTEKAYWDEADCDRLVAPYRNLRVTHITKKEFDHAATRQMAAEQSEADLFVMMTMDAMPKNRRLLEALAAGFDRGKVAVSYARQLPAPQAGLIERYTRYHNYPPESAVKTKAELETLGIKTYFCSDVCAAYDRRLFLSLGGFVPTAIFNEDMLYAAKAVQSGYAVYYAADAEVVHSHNYSGMQQLRRNFDLGVSQAQHPEVFDAVPAESTGIAMVKKTALFLLKKGRPWLLWILVWQSGCKYMGYRLGKAYKKLPASVVKRCSASPDYWEKEESTK